MKYAGINYPEVFDRICVKARIVLSFHTLIRDL